MTIFWQTVIINGLFTVLYISFTSYQLYTYPALDPCPTSFVKHLGLNCGGHVYDSKTTLGEALAACAKDSDCASVEDKQCVK